MRLSPKQDVKKGISSKSKNPSLWNLQSIFFNKKNKTQRHKVVKINPKEPKNSKKEQQTINLRRKNFGVTPYQKQKKRVSTQKLGLFNFLTLASLIFTASTLFYFYEVSHKITSKKTSIIELYKKYESIKVIRQKSEMLLMSLLKSDKTTGKLLQIIDTNNIVAKQAQDATKNYLNSKKNKQKEMTNVQYIPVVLWSLVFVMCCSFLRLYLLFKEREKLFVSSGLPNAGV